MSDDGVVESLKTCIEKNNDAYCIVCTIKEYIGLTKQLEDLSRKRGIDFEYAFNIEEIYNSNEYAYYRYINTKIV